MLNVAAPRHVGCAGVEVEGTSGRKQKFLKVAAATSAASSVLWDAVSSCKSVCFIYSCRCTSAARLVKVWVGYTEP